MDTVTPGLLASTPQRLPFARSVTARAFLLERERGNLLVYSASELEADLEATKQRGEITREYLNHHHEAQVAPEGLIGPLTVHEHARDQVAASAAVDATYTDRHTLDDDFEVIPTPGHTSGSTCFLWRSPEHRALFTGDTIYLSDGEWVAAVLDSSDRAAYIESLELISELDFDLLVPWNATAGQPYHATTRRSDAQRRIEAILARVRRGENR